MKTCFSFRFFFVLAAVSLAFATSAQAQFGGLGDLNKLQKGLDTAKNAGKVIKGVTGIGLEEERTIGGSVAIEIIAAHGGLWRDEAATRRVNLVGRSLARYSDRPALDWRFGVLDSPSINAYSAPGGYVFITRALYEKLADDDRLAGVLAHEIAHVTERHALKIVARSDFISGASGIAVARSSDAARLDSQLKLFDSGVGEITSTLFEKGFDPATEFEADLVGRNLATTAGFAPGGLRAVLGSLQGSTGGSAKLFDTHPPLGDRLARLPSDPAP
jgi:predicted Zn-dependent protease